MTHLAKIHRDGFRDVAFFRADAREGARGVDERDDGQAESVGHLHQTKGFAITFGIRAAKVTAEAFLSVAPFLLAEDHDGAAFEKGRTTDDGFVVHEETVAMELLEVVKKHPDII